MSRKNLRQQRMSREVEIHKEYLDKNGWKQSKKHNDNLNYFKGEFEYDYYSEILWHKGNSMFYVDSVKRLNECIDNINDVEKLKVIHTGYLTEF